jgi:hypothetical protein
VLPLTSSFANALLNERFNMQIRHAGFANSFAYRRLIILAVKTNNGGQFLHGHLKHFRSDGSPLISMVRSAGSMISGKPADLNAAL